jgi:predicted short-subunit dehydrogenase-like oxidoreductase (DUF2520 family)
MSTPLVIVGPGRLGRSAQVILARGGHAVQLIGRHEAIPRAELTWLTVPDREIEAAAAIVPEGGVLLHASGASTVDILRPHRPAGSLHPLMSFPGPENGLPTATRIPAAVAGDEAAQEAARGLAQKLGFSPFTFDGDRAQYHAAAVMAGNFATTLLVAAGRVLAASGISEPDARSLLAPLAMTSLHQSITHGTNALTGPIARGDEAIVKKHVEALTLLDPDLAELYIDMSTATRRIKG